MKNNLIERQARLRKTNEVMFWVTLVLGIVDVAWLILSGGHTAVEIIFRGLQFVAMLLVLKLPDIMRIRLKVELPIELSAMIVVFCFVSLVLGDGLDFYGRFPWWDSVLHGFSGLILSMVALWLIHVIMAKNDKYIYFNKYFLCLFLVMFSLGMGALWEIMEYLSDSILGTNSQQFMLTTTGSIITPEDEPLCGHAALHDTMKDLMFDFGGALLVAIYGFIRHDQILARYQAALHP